MVRTVPLRRRSRLIAARTAADRRFGLGGGILSVHHLHGESEQRRIGDVDELKGILGSTFGIDVPAGRDVDAALARVLEEDQRGLRSR